MAPYSRGRHEMGERQGGVYGCRRVAALAACIVMAWGGGTGCGMVGNPLPPEDIGIEAKVRAQAERARSTQEQNQPAPGEKSESEITLPPLQPLGIQ